MSSADWTMDFQKSAMHVIFCTIGSKKLKNAHIFIHIEKFLWIQNYIISKKPFITWSADIEEGVIQKIVTDFIYLIMPLTYIRSI